LQAISLRFQTRPELFSELFLSLLLCFLVYWSGAPSLNDSPQLRLRDKLGLAAVLVLFVVWANFHGGVLMGLLILAVTAGADLLQDRCNRRSRILTLLVLLLPLAICLNPYGVRY